MIVSELIRKLSQMDQNMPVTIEDAEGVIHDIDDVYETEDEENEDVIAIQVERS